MAVSKKLHVLFVLCTLALSVLVVAPAQAGPHSAQQQTPDAAADLVPPSAPAQALACTPSTGGISKITANDSQIVVTGSAGSGCPGTVTVRLLGPWQWQANPNVGAAAVAATVTADATGAFTASFARLRGSTDLLYYRFVAVNSAGAMIGRPHYVDDWAMTPLNTTARLTSVSPKGLGVTMTSDAEMLGVGQSGISLNLGEVMQSGPSADPTQDVTYTYNGATYYFKKSGLESLDRRVKPLSDNGIVVYLILVLVWDDSPNSIYPRIAHPDAPKEEPIYFSVTAFNTVTQDGTSIFAAAMEFLAQRYSRPDAQYGHIMDYILGNEIQSAGAWQKMGPKTLPDFIANFSPMLRIGWDAVRKVNKDIRVYTSFDNSWTEAADPQQPLLFYPGKDTLDELNRQIRAEGDFPWNLAHHPYPVNMLLDGRTWKDPVSNDFSTKKITMKNLELLPQYMRQSAFLYKGSQRHIVLSEQGCQDIDDSMEQQKIEAACFAYAFYKTVMAGGIDGFIWVFQSDPEEKDGMGLRMGLWNRDPREQTKNGYDPGEKKFIYNVFRDIDTARSLQVTDFALAVIGVSSWQEAIPGFDASKIPVRPTDSQVPAQVGGALTGASTVDALSALGNWHPADHSNKVEIAADAGSSGSGLRVHFDDPNVIETVGLDNKTWRGATSTFPTPLNATNTPILAVDLRVPQSALAPTDPDNQYQAQVRVYSTDGTVRYGITNINPAIGFNQIRVNLAGWSGRASINRIKVWAKGTNGQPWIGTFDMDSLSLAQSVAASQPNVAIRGQVSLASNRTATFTFVNNGPALAATTIAIKACDGVSFSATGLSLPAMGIGGIATQQTSITNFSPADSRYPAVCLTVGGVDVRLVLENDHLQQINLYNFDSNTQGWQAGAGVNSVSWQQTIANGPKAPHQGPGMLDGALASGPANQPRTVSVSPPTPLNLTDASAVTAWVNSYGGFEVATYTATITVYSGTDSRSASQSYKPDQWNSIGVSVSGWAGRSSVTKIVITLVVNTAASDWTGAHLQIDDVAYTPVVSCATGTPAAGGTWLAAGGAPLGDLYGGNSRPGATYRQAMTVSAGGDMVRVRFANPFTNSPLTFSCASIGIRDRDSAGTKQRPVPLTQNGGSTITVPANGVAYSDPIALPVKFGEQVLVSTYTPQSIPLQTHVSAQKTAYATATYSGNHTQSRVPNAFLDLGQSLYWIDGIDVAGNTTATGAVAVLGDSISDSAGTANDKDTRWVDWLAKSLAAQPAGQRRSVLNASIGGNALSGTHFDISGYDGLSRLSRDVLTRSGVTDVIVAEGTNDILLGSTAEQVIYAMTKAAQQIHDAKKRAIVMYIIQRKGGTYWTDAMEAERKKVNSWIASQQVFDATIDFRTVLQDPSDPDRLNSAYAETDLTHPNAAGAKLMGQSVNLSVFSAPIRAVTTRTTVLYNFDSSVQNWKIGMSVSGVQSSYAFPNGPQHPVAGMGALRATMVGPAGADRSVSVGSVTTGVTDPSTAFAWVNGYGGWDGSTPWPIRARLTVYSGTQEIAQEIPISADKWNKVAVDLKAWPYRNQITGFAITYKGFRADSGEFTVDEVGLTTG